MHGSEQKRSVVKPSSKHTPPGQSSGTPGRHHEHVVFGIPPVTVVGPWQAPCPGRHTIIPAVKPAGTHFSKLMPCGAPIWSLAGCGQS